MSRFPVIMQNIYQPVPTAKNLAIVEATAKAAAGGIFMLNEAIERDVKRELLTYRHLGWVVHQYNELAICWASSRFTLLDSGAAMVMRGGFRGAGTNPLDKRRRGPDRWLIWAVVRDTATGRPLIVATHHAIAKAFSTATWRRPLWDAAFRAVWAELADVVAEHPDAALLLAGDFNGPAPAEKQSLGMRWQKFGPTYPTAKPSKSYDHLGSYGLSVTNPSTVRTASDHLGIRVEAELVAAKPAPESKPKPEPVKETPVSKLPPNLPALLRAAGLHVVEHDDWQTRGRPASTGGFAPVGVLCHHTATGRTTSDANVVQLLIRGRSDLPGPLCQIGLARDGTVHLIAAGRANHAGKAKPSGSVAAGDGNRLYVGIEAFNDGRGEKWPAVQYDAYARLVAVLCKHVTGNSAATVRGHKETSITGKIDPTFDMIAFRARVAALLAGGDTVPPENKETDDMTADQIKKLDKAALMAERAVARGNVNTRLLLRIADELGAKIDDLAADVQALDAEDADEEGGA